MTETQSTQVERTSQPAAAPALTPTARATIRVLNALIETCKDGEKGYRNAASDVRDPTMRGVFLAYSDQRSHFAGELQRMVHGLGAVPENNGTLRGALRRGWMDLISALEGTSEHRVFMVCERAEETAMQRYEDALREDSASLTPAIVARVETQYAEILRAHGDIRRRRLGNG